MKSKTRHVDGEVGNRLCIGISWKHVWNNEIWEQHVGSKKTYKSKSVSQSRGKRLWNQNHDTLMVEVGNRMFIDINGKRMENIRFEKKKRRFTKDIQIQMCKPKSRETLMTSTSQHVDGGSRNPQFEAPRIWMFRCRRS